MKKAFKFIIILFLFLSLSGCTALLWSVNKPTNTVGVRKALIKDKVTGVLEYENIKFTTRNGSSGDNLPIPSKGVMFLGKNNVYILTVGSSQLLEMNELNDIIPLRSGFNNHTIELKLTGSTTKNILGAFSDRLTLHIDNNTRSLSEEEMSSILKLGFKSERDGYAVKIDVAGVIIPKKNIAIPFGGENNFNNSYNLEFYSTGSKVIINPEELLTNIVLTPLTLATDIIFFPISLPFLWVMSRY